MLPKMQEADIRQIKFGEITKCKTFGSQHSKWTQQPPTEAEPVNWHDDQPRCSSLLPRVPFLALKTIPTRISVLSNKLVIKGWECSQTLWPEYRFKYITHFLEHCLCGIFYIDACREKCPCLLKYEQSKNLLEIYIKLYLQFLKTNVKMYLYWTMNDLCGK